MLTFALYTADDYERRTRRVHIDPAAVVSVEEAERRPAFGGWYQVAVIALATGDKFIVEDGAAQGGPADRRGEATRPDAAARRDRADSLIPSRGVRPHLWATGGRRRGSCSRGAPVRVGTAQVYRGGYTWASRRSIPRDRADRGGNHLASCRVE